MDRRAGIKTRPLCHLWRPLAVGACALLTLSWPAAAADDELARARKELVAQGVEAKTADLLVRATRQAMEEEKIDPLLPFFRKKETPVVLAAAAAASFVDPEETATAIRNLLRKDSAEAPGLLLALCSNYQPQTVDFLLAEVVAKHTDERQESALFSLRVLTGQSFEEAADWQQWWKANRKDFTGEPPDDPDEQERRMNAAALQMKSAISRRKLQPLLATRTAAEKPDAADHALDILNDVIGTMDKAARLRVSPPARQGDEAFAVWKLEDAVTAYRKAIKADGNDFCSAMLCGCALFEKKEYDAARVIFEDLAARLPQSNSARLFVLLCDQGQPGSLLARARMAAETLPKPKDGPSLTGDPLVEALMQRSMASPGLLQPSQKSLDEIAGWWPDEPEIQLVIANRRRVDQKTAALEQVYTTFPKSPTVLAVQFMNRLSAARTADQISVAPLAAAWSAAEPNNALPALLAIYLRHPLKDPKSDKKESYEASVIAEIESALALPDFTDHRRALGYAKLRVLDAASCPFVFESIESSGMSALFQLVYRLATTARERLGNGDGEGALHLCDTLETLATKMRLISIDEVDKSMVEFGLISSLGIRKQHLEKTGGSPEKISELTRRQAESRKALNQSGGNAFLPRMLPLPSLQRAYAEERLSGLTP